ncbi:MAG: hypothetical protein ACO1OK_12195 [Devosia sp.]
MTDTTVFVRSQMEPVAPPPKRSTGLVAWLRTNLFATPGDTAMTIIAMLFVAWIAPPLFQFLVTDAVWSDPEGLRGEACRCWSRVRRSSARQR